MATTARDKAPSVNAAPGHWLEVLAVFLRLGLTSFGGPVAHLGYFRDELVQRGLVVTIRKTRGEDIDAACGQLAGQVTDRTVVRLGSKTFGLQVRA